MGDKFNIQNFESAEIETVEFRREMVNRLLEEISEKMNNEYGPLLDKECRINMDSFFQEEGYAPEKIERDQKSIQERKEYWSGADYEEDEENKQKAMREYEEELEKSQSLLFEKMVNVIFYEIVNEEFLVARTSLHDDQKHGVDHVIVNKETGEIICGVDEVESNNFKNKESKVKELNEKGGAKIEYGITFESDEESKKATLVRKQLEHIPVFYLGITKREFQELLKGMNGNLSPSQQELAFFENTIRSLERQRKELLEDPEIGDAVKKNLENLLEPLARMKGMRYEKFGY